MSPTILLADGRPWLALGSPGGATIITTVLQMLTGYVDRDLPLVGRDRRAAAVVAQLGRPARPSRRSSTGRSDAALAALGHR